MAALKPGADPAHAAARALRQLALPGAVLAPVRAGGGFGVFARGDRRRRPCARLPRDAVRDLAADGAIVAAAAPDTFILAPAGHARSARAAAPDPADAFLAQHAAFAPRAVIDAHGALARVRGIRHDPLDRLERMRDPAGAPFFSADELAAARRLRADWEAGQAGLIRGSDWAAPPRGASARTPGNAAERAMAAGCDARARCERALAALAAPMRRIVTRVCLEEAGLEALEAAEGWPARSAKIALKLALAQLAANEA